MFYVGGKDVVGGSILCIEYRDDFTAKGNEGDIMLLQM